MTLTSTKHTDGPTVGQGTKLYIFPPRTAGSLLKITISGAKQQTGRGLKLSTEWRDCSSQALGTDNSNSSHRAKLKRGSRPEPCTPLPAAAAIKARGILNGSNKAHGANRCVTPSDTLRLGKPLYISSARRLTPGPRGRQFAGSMRH